MPSPYSNEYRFGISHEVALITEWAAMMEANPGQIMTCRTDSTVSGSPFASTWRLRADYFSIQYDIILKSGASGSATQVDRVITIKHDPNHRHIP
jgi:hypothetical protein